MHGASMPAPRPGTPAAAILTSTKATSPEMIAAAADTAIQWFLRAGAQHLFDGALNCGRCYFTAEGGVAKRDLNEAVKWINAAAEYATNEDDEAEARELLRVVRDRIRRDQREADREAEELKAQRIAAGIDPKPSTDENAPTDYNEDDDDDDDNDDDNDDIPPLHEL
jgi:hypothetical protein